MALFFSRRTYNAQKKKFTANPAALTRYVSMTAQNNDGSVHTGSIVPRADWLKQVQQAGGTKEILIYVHGFNTSQKDMLDRLGKIETGVKAQGFEGAVIAYDWPSGGTILPTTKIALTPKRPRRNW